METMMTKELLIEPGCSSKSFTPSLYKFSCLRCATEFPNLTKLYEHKRHCVSLHKNSFPCLSCERVFSCRSLYVRHRCLELRKRRQKNLIHRLNSLKRSRSLMQGSEKRVKREIKASCFKCNEKFFSIDDCRAHLKSGECIRYSCGMCNQKFVNMEDLKIHDRFCSRKQATTESEEDDYALEKIQSKQKSRVFRCKACGKGYLFPQLLKKHLEQYPYCARTHNLKIKLRCMWERGDDFNKSARKSASNYKRSENANVSTSSNLPALGWDSDSSLSKDKDFYMKFANGSARKSLGRTKISDLSSYCEICYRYFDTYEEFEQHQEKHHGIEIEVEHEKGRCPKCLKLFYDNMSLIMHQNVEDHWGKAIKSMSASCTCPFCDKEFLLVQSRNAHLRSHVESHPDEVKEFIQETTCNKCSQIFVNDIAKSQHMRLKHGKRDEIFDLVEKSPRKLPKYSSKITHNITPTMLMQLKTNPTQCPICKKTYSTSFIRNRHFRSHTFEEVYDCPYCQEKFNRPERLTHHMQENHKESLGYECKECSMRFLTRMGCLQHTTKAHPGQPAKSLIKERNVFSSSQHKKLTLFATTLSTTQRKDVARAEFYCDVCELSFLKLCGLQRHRQSKLHRQLMDRSQKFKEPSPELIERPPLSDTPPFIDYSKKFTCSACSKVFDSVNDFVPHRMSHFSSEDGQIIDELNTYGCEICNKVMDSIQAIQLHLFWHMQDVQLQAGNKNAPNHNSDKPTAKKSFGKGSNPPQECVIGGVKKSLFTCKSCKIAFTTRQHYLVHIQKFCKAGKNTTITAGFCKICGCIFSSSKLYEDHKELFCNKHSFSPFDNNSDSVYTEMVKSLVRLNTMVAICVRCNTAFDSMTSLAEHVPKHAVQENGTADAKEDEKEVTKEDKSDDLNIVLENHNQFDEKDIKIEDDLDSKDNRVEGGQLVQEDNGVEGGQLVQEDNGVEGGQLVQEDNGVEGGQLVEEDNETITALRENFSKLLYVLVSDSSLMIQLGYGKEIIDDVLVSVMKKMGLEYVPEEEVCSKLDRLRKNIRMFMDVCIKDQIMALITDNKLTTDDIVVAALEMFGVTDETFIEEEESMLLESSELMT